jgi:hypothetical protein
MAFKTVQVVLLLLVVVPGATLSAQTFDAAAKAAAVAPYLDEQTLAVGRVNLQKIDPSAAVKLLSEIAPEKNPDFDKQLASVEQKAKEVLQTLQMAGVTEIYFVISLADVPQQPPFLVAPVKTGSDAQQAAQLLRSLTHLRASKARGGVAIVGSQQTLERLKNVRPAARPELAKAFEKAGDTAFQLIFSPNPDTRRVLAEMLPRIPDELGGGSGKMLVDGMQWAVLTLDAPPRLGLTLTVQSKDADSAAAVRALAVSGLALLREDRGVKQIPQLEEVMRVLTPRLMGDQLVITASERDGTAKTLLNVLVPAVQAARISAGRSQSMNHLKQIGLAMHNYHDTHGRLPPQAIRGKDGKPLLSWRVAILPFLSADPLYKEFRLDEPWDSEHNKTLIERMPPVLASPHLGDALRAKGMTSYLVPLSKPPVAIVTKPDGPDPSAAKVTPQMIFDDPAGVTFSKITDGTSNTIMVVEAHPTAAVIWTKPDDLVIDEPEPLKALRNQPNNGFSAVFCDGSVRFISNNVDLKTFRHLLQMNDGNPVGNF